MLLLPLMLHPERSAEDGDSVKWTKLNFAFVFITLFLPDFIKLKWQEVPLCRGVNYYPTGTGTKKTLNLLQ